MPSVPKGRYNSHHTVNRAKRLILPRRGDQSASYQSSSEVVLAVLLQVAQRQLIVLIEQDLGMTKRAVSQLEVRQLATQCLVLTSLAGVVFLLADAHATGNARRVVRATLLAVDVELVDDVVALGTVVFLLLLDVNGLMTEE